jgi:heme ABC exporter ATP-binding subunit CcmA
MRTEAPFASRVESSPTSGTTPLDIEVAGLTRAFGPKPALRGVDLSLARGARLALLGPNGAGKTTLLRVLATLTKPDGGRARVAGCDVVCDAAALRRMVGYVGHQPHIYEELTALENLTFFARMYGLPDPADRARELIELVGLASRTNDRARTFSRGQLQRLALARGIVHRPAVLLLDEPETGLDEAAVVLLAGLLAERARAGQTTLLTTHSLARGLAVADEVAVLARGRIVYSRRSAELDVATLREAYERCAGRER